LNCAANLAEASNHDHARLDASITGHKISVDCIISEAIQGAVASIIDTTALARTLDVGISLRGQWGLESYRVSDTIDVSVLSSGVVFNPDSTVGVAQDSTVIGLGDGLRLGLLSGRRGFVGKEGSGEGGVIGAGR